MAYRAKYQEDRPTACSAGGRDGSVSPTSPPRRKKQQRPENVGPGQRTPRRESNDNIERYIGATSRGVLRREQPPGGLSRPLSPSLDGRSRALFLQEGGASGPEEGGGLVVSLVRPLRYLHLEASLHWPRTLGRTRLKSRPQSGK